jgi:hypothetical protein
MASHDCVPNCIYDHINVNGEDQPPDFEVVLRSKRPIKKGEKIYISYVDILLPTYIRQKNLLEVKKNTYTQGYLNDVTNLFNDPDPSVRLLWRVHTMHFLAVV